MRSNEMESLDIGPVWIGLKLRLHLQIHVSFFFFLFFFFSTCFRSNAATVHALFIEQ